MSLSIMSCFNVSLCLFTDAANTVMYSDMQNIKTLLWLFDPCYRCCYHNKPTRQCQCGHRLEMTTGMGIPCEWDKH